MQTSSAVGAITLAGIWQASVMGIQIETIVIATGFTIMGSFARVGFELAIVADKPAGIRWSYIFALFGGSLASATTIAVVFLSLLKMVGIVSDSATLLGLIFCGFVGPKVLLWLFNTSTSAINKRTGLNFPQLGANGEVKL